MPNHASIEIKGHLGKDPEVRFSKSGKAICSFSLAYNPGKKEDNKPAVWFNCTAFGELAEYIGETFGKGDAIHIKRGSPELNIWEDKGGNEHRDLKWLVWDAVKLIKQGDKWVEMPKESPAIDDDDDDDIPF